MKSMTCTQLGGACDKIFQAETFEDIAALSQKHGAEMYHAKDAAHMEAIGKVKAMMSKPDAMQQWMNEKRQAFEALPND